MKIAVSAMGQSEKEKIDPRFGRCAGFVIYDSGTGKYSFVDNSRNAELPQGAGIQTGQAAAALGVDAIITGRTGPKATEVLKAAGVRIFTSEADTVESAVEACLQGALKEQE